MIVRSAAPRDSGEVQERTDSRALSAALAAVDARARADIGARHGRLRAGRARARVAARARACGRARDAGAATRFPPPRSRSPRAPIPRAACARTSLRPQARARRSRMRWDSSTPSSIARGANALALPDHARARSTCSSRGQHARAAAPDSLLAAPGRRARPRGMGREVRDGGARGARMEGELAAARGSERLRHAGNAARARHRAHRRGHRARLERRAYASAIVGVRAERRRRRARGRCAARSRAARARAGTRGRARRRGVALLRERRAAPRARLLPRSLALASDAVPLEARDGRVIAAARRVGAGRVVQLGYDETWRWRLAGSGDAPAAHRDYWSHGGRRLPRIVRRRRLRTHRCASGDAAPLASLYADLGAPSAAPRRRSTSAPGLRWWMFALLALLLLGRMGVAAARGVRDDGRRSSRTPTAGATIPGGARRSTSGGCARSRAHFASVRSSS